MSRTSPYAALQAPNLDAVVRQHAPLVKRIAYHLIQRLPPSVQVDDLIQAGMLGLLEAARQFDNSHGASFETYAGIRIRGAMLDEIRRSDWTPRSVHRKHREAAEAIRAIEAEHGREARDEEVAAHLSWSLEEYHQVLQDGVACRIFSIDEMMENGEQPWEDSDGGEPGPLQAVEADAFQRALAQAIDQLPEREKLVMALYYDEELNLKEIGEVLGVSESRVCQIHSQCMLRLRARMSGWLDETAPNRRRATSRRRPVK